MTGLREILQDMGVTQDAFDEFGDYGRDEECDHEEYEVDWEGRATCNYCREHWWMTADQLDAHHKAESEWMAEFDRIRQREESWLCRSVDWLRALPWRIKQRLPKRKAHVDEEIPF